MPRHSYNRKINNSSCLGTLSSIITLFIVFNFILDGNWWIILFYYFIFISVRAMLTLAVKSTKGSEYTLQKPLETYNTYKQENIISPLFTRKEEHFISMDNDFGLIEEGKEHKGKKINYQKEISDFVAKVKGNKNTITGIDINPTDCVPICIGKDYRPSIEINMAYSGNKKSLILEGDMFLLFAGHKSNKIRQAIVLDRRIDFSMTEYTDLYYCPSYSDDLTAKGRYTYLKWLADGRKFTNSNIPVGFGFIYFYTLEIAIYEKLNKNKDFRDISDKFILKQALSLLTITPDSPQAIKLAEYIRSFIVFILVKSDEFNLDDKKWIVNILRDNNFLNYFIVRDLWTRDTSTAFVLFMDAINNKEYCLILAEKLINKAKDYGLKKQAIFTKRGDVAKDLLLINLDKACFDITLVFKKIKLDYCFNFSKLITENNYRPYTYKKYDGYKLEFDVAVFIDCYNKTVDELRVTKIKPAKKTEEPISTQPPKKFTLDLSKIEEIRNNDASALLHEHLADNDSTTNHKAIDTRQVQNPTSNFDIKTIVEEIVQRSSYTKNELMVIVKKYNLKTINILIDKINEYGYNVLNLDDPIISDDEDDMFKVENLGNLTNEP